MDHRLSRYRWSMRLLFVFYTLGAAAVVFYPSEIFYLLNVGPKVFKVTEAVPELQEKFWSVLAGAGAAMLAALALLASESPFIRGYALVQIWGNVVAACGFFTMFTTDKRFFAYIVGIIFTLFFAVITAWITLGVRQITTEAATEPSIAPPKNEPLP